MKTIFPKINLLFVLMLISGFAFGQANNLVVFSNDGYRFTLIVNGLKQNEKPETNVKVTGLTAPNYKLRVIFEDANNATIDQNIYMAWGGEDLHGKELNCAIIRNKKGELKLRPESVGELSNTAAANQVVYIFNSSGNGTPAYSGTTTTTTTSTTTSGTTQGETVTMNVGMGGTPAGTSNTTTTVNSGNGGSSTTTTTTSTTTTGTSDNVNIGMGTPGGNIGISINVNDGMGGISTSTSTTTTTTSTTSSSGGTTTTTTAPPSGNGCLYPMSSSDFAKAKESVKSKSFEDSKLTVAKQILNTNCLSSAQVKEIMQLFTYEETKLDWAKFAYGKTTDPGNYYQLNDAFTFETSIEELNNYIKSH